MSGRKLMFFAPLFVVLSVLPAQAYIGPGAGAGTIAVVLGILASILMAFVALIWYPAKRLFKSLRGGMSGQAKSDTADAQ